jgi:hypothetical protein
VEDTNTSSSNLSPNLSPNPLPLTQVGWIVEEAVVSFEKVQDWARLKCQRHICEIQGLSFAPKLTDLYRKPILS